MPQHESPRCAQDPFLGEQDLEMSGVLPPSVSGDWAGPAPVTRGAQSRQTFSSEGVGSETLIFISQHK